MDAQKQVHETVLHKTEGERGYYPWTSFFRDNLDEDFERHPSAEE